MNKIAVIWLIFFILFMVLSICHFVASVNKINPFKERIGFIVESDGIPTNQEFNMFVDQFVHYVKNYNKQSATQNILSGIGYSLASVTALISMILSINLNETEKHITKNLKE